MLIPKVLHQIWFGGPIPEKYIRFTIGWRRLHPEWEYILWTEERLPRLYNQACFDAAKELCQKSDIARYEILWRFGGVYVDSDFECIKNIEPLLDGVAAFLGYEDPQSVNNAIIGSVPRHPALGNMMAAVPRRFHLPGPPFFTTGPALVTQVLVDYPGVRLFQPVVFYPLFWSRRIDPVLTHAIHHYKTPKFDKRLNQLGRPAGRLATTHKGKLVCIPREPPHRRQAEASACGYGWPSNG